MTRPLDPATILFAQELGAGFGHVNTLLAVARGLPGHRPVFAVPDPGLTRPAILAALGPATRVIAAPGWAGLGPAEATGLPYTMADILFQLGYAEAGLLATAVRSWRAIVEETAPDLVVGDFAPTLRLVTGGRIPAVVVGSGFAVPPPGAPLPPFDPDPQADLTPSTVREAKILDAVNGERDRLGLPALAGVADLFQGERTFATTVAALDPYRRLRTGPALAPVNIPAVPVGPSVERRTGPHVFCYLDPDAPSINPVLTALNGLMRPAQVFVRDLDPQEVARHCAPHVGVYRDQADFRALLPQTRLLIHHGGRGTTLAGLLAGTPQLILPRHIEQDLTVKAIAPFETAVGLRVAVDADPLQLRRIIESLLDHRILQANARRRATEMQRQRRDDVLGNIVAACSALLHTVAAARVDQA